MSRPLLPDVLRLMMMSKGGNCDNWGEGGTRVSLIVKEERGGGGRSLKTPPRPTSKPLAQLHV